MQPAPSATVSAPGAALARLIAAASDAGSPVLPAQAAVNVVARAAPAPSINANPLSRHIVAVDSRGPGRWPRVAHSSPVSMREGAYLQSLRSTSKDWKDRAGIPGGEPWLAVDRELG